MSILGNIFGKIFHRGAAAAPAGTPASTTVAAAPAQQPGTQPTAPAPVAMDRVDVEQVLNGMAAQNGQQLNWRTSIVDLMKLLDIDSSLQARKDLADELHYTGDKGDSAAMNIWLHKQVMHKLEENGGKVPADLKD
ncbi:DUF3597 domain-containing protein [Ramlibacter sp.]|uniref:DUF3597 domain-containing protein n=1 Tax=Ramlibacter sp. TaxID=1917967 RepID=UPI0017BC6F7A|nr:DUF3597 domain-containing protein [Ramlibacter sp.]MBA2674261.1 DUF3597 domain-containing protein [Ramlibacter sp.]